MESKFNEVENTVPSTLSTSSKRHVSKKTTLIVITITLIVAITAGIFLGLAVARQSNTSTPSVSTITTVPLTTP